MPSLLELQAVVLPFLTEGFPLFMLRRKEHIFAFEIIGRVFEFNDSLLEGIHKPRVSILPGTSLLYQFSCSAAEFDNFTQMW